MPSSIRFALRALFKSPSFTAIAIATIALAVGANTALFSVFDRLVLRPIDLPESDRLVRIWINNPDRNLLGSFLSVPRYEMIRDTQQSFASLAASTFSGHTLTRENADPEQLTTFSVTASWVPALGLQLARGRNFTAEEDSPGGAPVVILGYDIWKNRLGAREDIVGGTVMLNGLPHTVVGILPERLPSAIAFIQGVVPRPFEGTGLTPEQIRNGAGYLQVTARLKAGVSFEQADTEVRTIAKRYKEEFPGRLDASNANELRTWTEEIAGQIRPTFLLLLGAVALVLLIACANVSNLFLSRLTARHKEIAIRLSMGATRRQLIGQFLLETGIFCAIAAALGVLAATWSLEAITRLTAGQLPPNTVFELNFSTLLFTLGLTVLASVAIGLVPAFQASKVNLAEVLKDTARGQPGGTRGGRFRATLIVVEVVLSVLLLVGSGLLLTSFLRLQSTPPGFNATGVAGAFVNIPLARYKTGPEQAAFAYRVIDKLKSNPQVKYAAATTSLPTGNFGARTVYAIEGQPVPSADKRPIAFLTIATEEYFPMLQIPLKQGRLFNASDRADTPGVVVLNESFAKRLFPDGSALGKVLLRGPQANIKMEIIGIVADVKAQGVNAPVPDILYFPFNQLPRAFMTVAARVEGDPLALNRQISAAVAAVDPIQATSFFTTLEQSLRNALGIQRITAALTAAFAGVALLLSALGLYSVLAYAVTQRTGEIGIRVALGAQKNQVIGLILSQGMRLVLLGLVAGLGLAAALSRFIRSLLYQVEPLDPLVFAAVPVLFVLVALIACLAPSLRASRVDPLVALRTE